MPTREEMRSLAEEIVGSYADRVAGIAELKQAEGERKQTEAREIAQRKSDVSTMLKGFDEEQAAMSQELKADLAKVAPAIKQAEGERKQTEAREIAQRKSDVGTMLKEFDDSHATMSKELRTKLASDEQERHQTTSREIAQRKSDVGTMLKEFDKEHAAMSQELRTKLASDEQERHQTTSREIAQRKSDVGTMLREFHEEQAGVRDEWQILSAIMQEKRGGPMVMMEPPVEEIAEEAAVEITLETAALRNQVFEYLANHPDGTRLVELEQEFGVARIKVARLLKGLMDENKVEKQDMLYFAI